MESLWWCCCFRCISTPSDNIWIIGPFQLKVKQQNPIFISYTQAFGHKWRKHVDHFLANMTFRHAKHIDRHSLLFFGVPISSDWKWMEKFHPSYRKKSWWLLLLNLIVSEEGPVPDPIRCPTRKRNIINSGLVGCLLSAYYSLKFMIRW